MFDRNSKRKRPEHSAAQFLPKHESLPDLRQAASKCEGCDLYKKAKQTVFGEGRSDARLMLVGEQPGDFEDRYGKPFIGPAGKLLDSVLEEVGIDRKDIYLTNAVKHFKFLEKGKRRLHATPRTIEIDACYPWLEKEIKVVDPDVVVCLGATAAKAVLGTGFALMKQRGQVFETSDSPQVIATFHPSALLRAPDEEKKEEMLALMKEDLRHALSLLTKPRRVKKERPQQLQIVFEDEGAQNL
jgi:DNA polymerase